MANKELQAEEREVLLSIYEGDESFKQLSESVFQYKYGEHDQSRSFLLELQWGPNYPKEKPTVNMDTFYNRNLLDGIKNKVIDLISQEAENFLGEAMTYSLFECVKEKYDELLQEQPESVAKSVEDCAENIDKLALNKEESSKKTPKKEQLTKAQKRRQWDKVEAKGEKPRGWDWVDIVKHLSQTGGKESMSTD